jgi:hypothetical protein
MLAAGKREADLLVFSSGAAVPGFKSATSSIDQA